MSDWFIAWPDWKYKVEREEQTMPKHVHEWELKPDFECQSIGVCECGKFMEQDEMVRRLNATERLSAEIKKTVTNLLVRGKISEEEHDYAMQRIADILEGK